MEEPPTAAVVNPGLLRVDTFSSRPEVRLPNPPFTQLITPQSENEREKSGSRWREAWGRGASWSLAPGPQQEAAITQRGDSGDTTVLVPVRRTKLSIHRWA